MSGVNRSFLLEGNIRKGLLKLAFPLMFLNLVNSLYNIVDTFWIGKMGELQVGAVALIGPIMGCGSAFVTGLSAAGISMVAKALGSRQKEIADKVAYHLIMTAIFFGLVIGIFCFVGCDFILKWLATPADIYDDARAYLMGISFDFVFLFVINIFQTIRQADGDTKTAVTLNAIAAVLNTILDPLFIFTFNLGVMGAAMATVLSKVLIIPLVFWILFTDYQHVHCHWKEKFDLNCFKEIILVGLPASAAQFLSSFGFVLMNKSIVGYGSVAISAYGIGNKVTDFYYIPVNAFGGALAPFIGQNLGANNPERAMECFKKTMQITAICSAIVMVIGFVASYPLVLMFVPHASQELLSLSVEYCMYVVVTIFFMGWFQNIHGVFSGAGNTKIILILSLIRLWGLRLPMIVVFYHYTQLGPTGIWVAMVLSNFITCCLGQYFYQRKQWIVRK